jgi:DNA polymerase (family 10)
MDNAQIADYFSLLAKLMDIHGENSFKSKSYASAAFAIEKLTLPLADLPQQQIFSIKGIGESTGKKIIELLQTGNLVALSDLIKQTPEGILEMMNIKGLGPKKIASIWKEMGIETVGELLYACKENRLKLYKGFGEKTQQSIAETIEYYLNNKGSFLYAQVHSKAGAILNFFKNTFPDVAIEFTGAYTRQLEIVEELEIVIDQKAAYIQDKLSAIAGLEVTYASNHVLFCQSAAGIKIKIYSCDILHFWQQVFLNSASAAFSDAFNQKFTAINYQNCSSQLAICQQAGIQYIPPFLREDAAIISLADSATALPVLIQPTDIKSIIHCHSDWSDGSHTIEKMAKAAIAKGMEYMVISDHSKSAFYANGLSEERLRQQHQYIDELNQQLAPFKIFKSIESDILNDGSLDYSNGVLETFDLVIASVHSNLKMTEDKAMMRLINAIENPYTTILGHMTGRLLLSRKGYPVDHKKIIDACAANRVVIELNAHPNRLDIDWRHIAYALEKNVLISINPDAHFVEGFDDIEYGVLVAQKAMLTKEQNLSSFSLAAFEDFLAHRKK